VRVHILDSGGEGINKIATWLSENKNIMEVTVLKDPRVFLEKVESEKPELVFINIRDIDISGLQIGRMIKAMDFKVRIVFIADEGSYAAEAYDVGANGYLLCPLEKKKFDKILLIIKDRIRSEKIRNFLEKRRR